MSEKYNDLRSMSMDDLISKYDQLSKNTVFWTKHYYDEIIRRDNEQSTKKIIKLTKWITVMTLVMTIATIVNIIIFFIK